VKASVEARIRELKAEGMGILKIGRRVWCSGLSPLSNDQGLSQGLATDLMLHFRTPS
jgi:hypothetical protein